MVRICLTSLVYMALAGVLIAQNPAANTLPRLAHTIVFKVHPAFKDACSVDDIDIPIVQEALLALKGNGVEVVFPTHASPNGALDEAGRPLIDLSQIYRFTYTSNLSEEEVAAQIERLEAIAYAEPWYTHELYYQPNDPRADTVGGNVGMWHLAQIKAREAWSIERNDTAVVIGVVDSGTEADHPDLLDNVAFNHDDPIDGLDNDQDGYIDNYKGWDFAGNTIGSLGDNNPSIGNVHGLWVTGIVGATADNNRGLPGLCFNCRYLPIKAAPDDSIGIITGGYPGIVYAADQGADVINCSWGSAFKSRFGEEVVNYATINRGAAVVAAAGNDMADKRNWPAAYPAVISVANTSIGDTICCNSTFDYTIDMSAPGEFILSTRGAASYFTWGGTSASSPVAAGAIALTKAHFPSLTAAQAAQRVRVSCDDIYDINPSYLDRLGSGRVNMYRALTDPARPSVRIEKLHLRDEDGDGLLAAGDTISIGLELLNYLEPTQMLGVSLEIPALQQGFVELIDDSIYVGGIETMSVVEPPSTFRIRLREPLPVNLLLALRFVFNDAPLGYQDIEVREHRVNTPYLDITENKLWTTVNSQGNFGFHDFYQQEEGKGVQFRGLRNALSEGGLMIGNAANKISDRVRNASSRDLDFQAVESVNRQTGTSFPEFVAEAKFSDGFAIQPLGVSITQTSYAFVDSPYHQFVIFRYIVENSTNQPINNLYAGLFADWDISPLITPNRVVTQNAAANNAALKLGYSFDARGLDSSYYGVSLLTAHPFTTYAGDADGTIFGSISKFNMLRGSPTAPTGNIGQSGAGVDAFQVVGGGPFSLAEGAADTMTFAVLAGSSLPELEQQVLAAQEAYTCWILEKGPGQPFFVGDTLAGVDQPIAFTDQNANATQWFWDFGDGATATVSNPAHSYSESGQYLVQLTVSNNQCRRTFAQTITVSPPVNLPAMLPDPSLKVYAEQDQVIVQGEHWDKAESVEISLWTIQGRMVKSLRRQLNPDWKITLATQTLVPGMYVIQVRSADKQLSQKVRISN